MDRTRLDLVMPLGGADLFNKLHAVAVKHGVTVDDVVQAGLSRGGVPPAAVTAAREVAAHLPGGTFEALGKWPLSCLRCSRSFATETERAETCYLASPPGAALPHGCEAFLAARAEATERARLELAEREALLASLDEEPSPTKTYRARRP